MAQVVERELLTKEPYRSYGVDLDEFFSSGSDRVFADLTSLPGIDLPTVTQEAIRAHPQTFISGIGGTIWAQLWARRVFAPGGRGGERRRNRRSGEPGFHRRQRAKAARARAKVSRSLHRATGPAIWTLGGQVREVWRSATEHPLVFDDPRDEQRYAEFERDTDRLAGRIPTRDANQGLVHRLTRPRTAFRRLSSGSPSASSLSLCDVPHGLSSRSRLLLPASWSSSGRRSSPWTCPSTPYLSPRPSCCLRRPGSSVPTRAGGSDLGARRARRSSG